eukprot:TRINITY_DN11753_c0_g1_i4.p1 TRINITY_DN11753_c0_g1~~TRINITY_DN11753_c0_g1_i4.p1  ORF type:complete len:390 (+),score=88.33 TRINITY_DN11753_c0_g1_i4:66-1172(+)
MSASNRARGGKGFVIPNLLTKCDAQILVMPMLVISFIPTFFAIFFLGNSKAAEFDDGSRYNSGFLGILAGIVLIAYAMTCVAVAKLEHVGLCKALLYCRIGLIVLAILGSFLTVGLGGKKASTQSFVFIGHAFVGIPEVVVVNGFFEALLRAMGPPEVSRGLTAPECNFEMRQGNPSGEFGIGPAAGPGQQQPGSDFGMASTAYTPSGSEFSSTGGFGLDQTRPASGGGDFGVGSKGNAVTSGGAGNPFGVGQPASGGGDFGVGSQGRPASGGGDFGVGSQGRPASGGGDFGVGSQGQHGSSGGGFGVDATGGSGGGGTTFGIGGSGGGGSGGGGTTFGIGGSGGGGTTFGIGGGRPGNQVPGSNFGI